jgi:hypothetical protein
MAQLNEKKKARATSKNVSRERLVRFLEFMHAITSIAFDANM